MRDRSHNWEEAYILDHMLPLAEDFHMVHGMSMAALKPCQLMDFHDNLDRLQRLVSLFRSFGKSSQSPFCYARQTFSISFHQVDIPTCSTTANLHCTHPGSIYYLPIRRCQYQGCIAGSCITFIASIASITLSF